MQVLSEGDPMIYICAEDVTPRKTYWDFYANGGYGDDTFIDSRGRFFKVKAMNFVRFGKFGGYNLHFSKGRRTVFVELEYEPQEGHISLGDLKTKLKQMAAQEQDFWDESFGDMAELNEQVDNAGSYEQLFMLFR